MSGLKKKAPSLISFDTPDIPMLLLMMRESKALTQAECAKIMGSSSTRAYEQYESGARTPSITQLTKLLNVFGFKLSLFALEPPLDSHGVLSAIARKVKIQGIEGNNAETIRKNKGAKA